MLRLNFNYHENKLRITSLTTEHKNHEIGPEHFGAKRPKISPQFDGSIKKESPGSRSSKSSASSGSSKCSPAPTAASTWSSSNPVTSTSESKEPSFQAAPIPSLATILASAYNGACPVYPPQPQQVNPILQHSLSMAQNSGDLSGSNAVLGQKENFCVPNVALPPISQLSQFPASQINLPVLQLQQSNVAPTQDNVMMKVLEIFQRSSIMNIIEQYKKATQDKVRTLQDEYRQLLSTLSSCPISSDPAVMEHVVSSLRSLTDFVQQNLPKPQWCLNTDWFDRIPCTVLLWFSAK